MNPLFQIVFDFALFAFGVALVGGAIRGVLYPASREGHHFRRPLYLKSTVARVCALLAGLVLLIWLIFRLSRLS